MFFKNLAKQLPELIDLACFKADNCGFRDCSNYPRFLTKININYLPIDNSQIVNKPGIASWDPFFDNSIELIIKGFDNIKAYIPFSNEQFDCANRVSDLISGKILTMVYADAVSLSPNEISLGLVSQHVLSNFEPIINQSLSNRVIGCYPALISFQSFNGLIIVNKDDCSFLPHYDSFSVHGVDYFKVLIHRDELSTDLINKPVKVKGRVYLLNPQGVIGLIPNSIKIE